ncbi:unnamed protein product [Eruca vesicaria subsp. sativa]|uniref:Uncharacterized protein n=1 Tax=Eruca vesicaria subsp. sativa TaxID=29727 RepID=A0ABC8K953_ERUVS|nr:unnamed protein product [Eruca vesicaria subsp. sativa]
MLQPIENKVNEEAKLMERETVLQENESGEKKEAEQVEIKEPTIVAEVDTELAMRRYQKRSK